MSIISFFLLALLAVSQGHVLHVFKSRIVNGTVAQLGELPFQVSLQQSNWAFCGGSIISEYYVVTAAHCLVNNKASNVKVIVGTTDWKKPGQVHQVKNIILHEKYNPSDSYINDIALIEIETPFQYSDTVKPVLLPMLHERVNTNTIATVSGWGRLGGKKNIKPDILHKAEIFITDTEYCKSIMQKKIYDTHLCANDPTIRKGQCTGDSGGPLTVNGKLVGIVSWSFKDPFCASSRYPGIYTRVSEYIDWISEKTV